MKPGTPKEKSRGRVGRVVQLLMTLSKTGTSPGRGYTADELAKLFGISRRTLFRDLKEIQGVGIQPTLSRSRRGYVLPPEQFLPPINLNLQEALGLLLLVHKMRNQIQMPFKHSALLAAMKIESRLPPRVRNYCENALARISTIAEVQAPPPTTPGLDNIFALLQSAAAQRKKVRVEYDSLHDGKVIPCEVTPYHLLYNQRVWYIVGWSSVHKAVRTFELNHIRRAEILDEQFDDKDGFDLAEYLGCAWSMMPEGKMYHVRLRFAPKIANNVTAVNWHKSQRVTRNPDGSATIDFRVDGLGEITWWILGYGDQVDVLAPAALRKNVAEIAKRMVEINNNTREPQVPMSQCLWATE
ncbi:MAG: transcriptional regulator [Sedimentisphaerales bacterium]